MALRSAVRILGGLGGLGLVGFSVMSSQLVELEPWLLATGSVSFGLTLLWMWMDRHEIDRALRSRTAQQSTGALVLTALAAAMAVGANIAVQKHDMRWDVTSNDRYATSAQTLAVLSALETPIKVRAFFAADSLEKIAFEDLLLSYAQHTGQIELSVHDPVREPALADQYQIESPSGTVILTAGEQSQRLETDFGEEALTNAVIRVTTSVEHTICATTGHGEIDPDDDQNPASISTLVTKLERQNYAFRKVNLHRAGSVPKDCDLLLLADPRTNFTQPETTALQAYIEGGGQSIVMLDPGHASGLAADLAQFGVDVGDNLVFENHPQFQLMGGDASYLVVAENQMTDHPITQPIQGMVLLRVARTVQATQPPVAGYDVGELFVTSDYAYAETTLDGSSMPTPDPEDPAGRLGLAAVSIADSGGRLVVFGDSDFASNELLDQASNFDLLPNTIAWLVGEEEQVSIRPNPAAQGSFTMNSMQGILMWLISVLFLPAFAVGGAVSTWLVRRKL
jgi:ABC-type uncharacterized transport system involved in gliding motility auxiliary subunit